MSSPKVILYKNLDVSAVTITKPEKTKGKYHSYVSYAGNPLYIQTASCRFVEKEKDELTFAFKKDTQFAQILKKFDDYCIEYITDKSSEFFAGKRFSREKIETSYVKSYTEVDEDIHYTVNADKDSLLIKDQLNKDHAITELEKDDEVVFIVHVGGVQFKSTSMKIVYTAKQIKVYIKPLLSDWCIAEDSDDEDEESVDDIEKQIEAVEYIVSEHFEVPEEQAKGLKGSECVIVEECPESNADENQEQKSKDFTIVEKVDIPAENDDDKDLF